MRKFFRRSGSSSLSLLYDEFSLPRAIRRSLSLILLANLFGNLHGIICGGGTTAMVILSTVLRVLVAVCLVPPLENDRDETMGHMLSDIAGGVLRRKPRT